METTLILGIKVSQGARKSNWKWEEFDETTGICVKPETNPQICKK